MTDRCNINGVVHKDFLDDGTVQALAFESQSGKKTVGVVVPGRHDFGIVDVNPATIVVTSGTLIINGTLLEASNRYFIKKGDHIVFEAEDYASYLCIKG